MPISLKLDIPSSSDSSESIRMGQAMSGEDKTLPHNITIGVADGTTVWVMHDPTIGANTPPPVATVLSRGFPVRQTAPLRLQGHELDSSQLNGNDYFFAVAPDGQSGDVRIIG